MGVNLKNIQLIIFDCDGVLVDSEIIANRVFAEEMNKLGFPVDMEYVMANYLGKSHQAVREELHITFGEKAPEVLVTFEEKMVDTLNNELQPVNGISEVLQLLEMQNIPKCVASNNLAEKISLSLHLTGLASNFHPEHVFCAGQVKQGKPHPDLFLYAAEKMQIDPSACLVIEDSVAGIQAAHAAKMQVIGFFGGKHTHYSWFRQLIRDANPHHTCETHAELASQLASLN